MTFTVTDLTKVIDGVPTRVVWDVDVNEDELAERELAFFAQDDNDNVWNLGEYPEEFEDGAFFGAPNTWIAGVAGAEAGYTCWTRHRRASRGCRLLAHDRLPRLRGGDQRGRAGLRPGCLLRPGAADPETSPLDPEGGIQTKYHASGVGIIQVGAVDDPEGETLVLTGAAQLEPGARAIANREALELDTRGYAISEVYGVTPPAEAPPGSVAPPDTPVSPGGLSRPGRYGAARRRQPGRLAWTGTRIHQAGRQVHGEGRPPAVPLTSVKRIVFEGREGDTKTRVVSRV